MEREARSRVFAFLAANLQAAWIEPFVRPDSPGQYIQLAPTAPLHHMDAHELARGDPALLWDHGGRQRPIQKACIWRRNSQGRVQQWCAQPIWWRYPWRGQSCRQHGSPTPEGWWCSL